MLETEFLFFQGMKKRIDQRIRTVKIRYCNCTSNV